MNFKQITLAALVVAGLSTSLVSCKSQADKDAEMKAKIEAVTPGATVTVKDGVATLSGENITAEQRMTFEEAAQKIDGVKSVNNNIAIPAPPVVNADNEIITAAQAIVANYTGVNASVVNGTITLTGEIKRSDLTTLMQALNAINAGKIDNQLVIK